MVSINNCKKFHKILSTSENMPRVVFSSKRERNKINLVFKRLVKIFKIVVIMHRFNL